MIPRSLLLRLLATLGLFLLALLLAALLLARWALGLDDAAVFQQLQNGLFAFGGAIVLWALLAIIGLLPLPKEAPASTLLRTTLRFPLRFAVAGLATLSLGAAIKLFTDLWVSHLPRAEAVSLLGTTLAVDILLVSLSFVLARGWIYPLVATLHQEELPKGLHFPVSGKVTFALVAVAIATTIPTAITYVGRTRQAERHLQNIQARDLAQVLAHGLRFAGDDAAREAMATVSPEIAEIRVASTKSPLAARLPTSQGWIQVHPSPRAYDPSTFIVILSLAVLALALLLGLDLGRSVGLDVRLVTRRVSALLERDSASRGDAPDDTAAPLVPRAPQLAEIQALVLAVNDLLLRIAKINVGSFLAVEEILEADRLKAQFLANMSHDLKSPLNAILGFAELLERGMEGDLPPRQRDAVKYIHSKGTDLFHLIVEVLDAAKVEAGRMSLLREDTLPTQFITEAVRRLRDDHRLQEIQIETSLQAGLPPIHVDASRLTEALVYILRFEAYELGNAGKISLHATLKRDEPPPTQAPAPAPPAPKRWLVIEIGDESSGISDERHDTLFEGFRREPGHRGLGLGLPLARAFLELHGGSLEVRRRAQRGKAFVLRIPFKQHKALGRIRPVKV